MFISLGYSCQTRFMIDALHADQKRQPFDFNISSRSALIAALATDGRSMLHSEDNTSAYVMTTELRQGIEVSGMYFWHDYPLAEDKLSLSPDWRAKISDVNAKYRHLWPRFSAVVRSDEPKTFVLSNAQRNLPEFAADTTEFDRKFGLGRQAFMEITAALDAYGARSYTMKFLSRSMHEVAETAGIVDPDRLDHRFVGAMKLRPDADVVAGLFSPATTASGKRALPA